jgi:hypothetical protein
LYVISFFFWRKSPRAWSLAFLENKVFLIIYVREYIGRSLQHPPLARDTWGHMNFSLTTLATQSVNLHVTTGVINIQSSDQTNRHTKVCHTFLICLWTSSLLPHTPLYLKICGNYDRTFYVDTEKDYIVEKYFRHYL